MKRLKPHFIGAIFLGAVLLPSIMLSFLAIRAMHREEAYIEKQLQHSLLAEVSHTVSVINTELAKIQDELNGVIMTGGSISALDETVFERWKRRSNLVSVPFLVSPQREIIWPRYSELNNKEETLFLKANTDFLVNRAAIPVYRNVAVMYQQQIVGYTNKGSAFSRSYQEVQQAAPSEYVAYYANSYTPEKQRAPAASVADNSRQPPSGSSEGGSPGVEPVTSDSVNYSASQDDRETDAWRTQTAQSVQTSQEALAEFETNVDVRKKVFEQAQKEGQRVVLRNVLPSMLQRNGTQSKLDSTRPESQFVSQSLRLQEILSTQKWGIIPRYMEDTQRLLFCKRLDDGFIAGCLIDQEQLNGRIMKALPQLANAVRSVMILKEDGNPLFIPTKIMAGINWHQPFVSREISEFLPRWEVAAYLTDPKIIHARAQASSVIVGILIALLFVTISSGGLVIVHLVYSEMRLAQQKTTFVANVSHELKTPLTSIRMFIDMLREKRVADEQKKAKYLDIMSSETERLTRLINNVLDFSRLEQGKKQYTMKEGDLVALCREFIENQKVRLEENGFVVAFTARQDTVVGVFDAEAVKQVLLNLISNAEKYSPERKEIAVEVIAEQGNAVININDRGMGISPREAAKIFREFYRVDDSLTAKIKGTGLGLAIARRIIRDHGGDITFMPHDGGGSVFQIRLPLRSGG